MICRKISFKIHAEQYVEYVDGRFLIKTCQNDGEKILNL